MAGLNKAMIIGHLGSKPEMRYTPAGLAVAHFSVATNETWTDKQGQKQEKTEWHRCTAWGKQAEVCAQYLDKGKQVYVEGKIGTREWEDKDKIKRYTTEITVNAIQFLGSPPQGGARPPHPADQSAPATQSTAMAPSDSDDIPF